MKFRLFLHSFNRNQLRLAIIQIKISLSELESIDTSIVLLPIKKKRFCVLRSPHIDKDSREEFEIQTHKCLMDINITSFSIINKLLNLEIPAGVVSSFKFFY